MSADGEMCSLTISRNLFIVCYIGKPILIEAKNKSKLAKKKCNEKQDAIILVVSSFQIQCVHSNLILPMYVHNWRRNFALNTYKRYLLSMGVNVYHVYDLSLKSTFQIMHRRRQRNLSSFCINNRLNPEKYTIWPKRLVARRATNSEKLVARLMK